MGIGELVLCFLSIMPFACRCIWWLWDTNSRVRNRVWQLIWVQLSWDGGNSTSGSFGFGSEGDSSINLSSANNCASPKKTFDPESNVESTKLCIEFPCYHKVFKRLYSLTRKIYAFRYICCVFVSFWCCSFIVNRRHTHKHTLKFRTVAVLETTKRFQNGQNISSLLTSIKSNIFMRSLPGTLS